MNHIRKQVAEDLLKMEWVAEARMRRVRQALTVLDVPDSGYGPAFHAAVQALEAEQSKAFDLHEFLYFLRVNHVEKEGDK